MYEEATVTMYFSTWLQHNMQILNYFARNTAASKV